MKLNEFLDDAKGDVLVCGCGCGYGSRTEHWGNLLTAKCQHEIRVRAGVPVYSLSGARCPRHNAQIAITERSQHSIATALDLACPRGWELAKFYSLCVEVVQGMTGGQGGVGKYPKQNFVHIDSGLGEAPGRRWVD